MTGWRVFMARLVIPTLKTTDTSSLQVSIHIQAEVLSAETARRAANVWLLENVGNLLLADAPELILDENLMWRVDVILTSPKRGWIGRVGRLELDAKTGDILADESVIQEIIKHASLIAAT
jgi:hypothetical protein